MSGLLTQILLYWHSMQSSWLSLTTLAISSVITLFFFSNEVCDVSLVRLLQHVSNKTFNKRFLFDFFLISELIFCITTCFDTFQ